MKTLKKLGLTLSVSVLFCFLFAVLVNAATVTFLNKDGKATETTLTTDDNGNVTMPNSTSNTVSDGQTLVWYSEDGRTWNAGDIASFDEDITLNQIVATNVTDVSGIKNNTVSILMNDIASTEAISTNRTIILNGYNMTFNGDLLHAFSGQRAYLNLYGKGTIDFTTTKNDNNVRFIEVKSHSYAGDGNKTFIGRDVTINTHSTRDKNVFFAFDNDGSTTKGYPYIRIYGTINADGLLKITNTNNRNPIVEIYEGANINLSTGNLFFYSSSNTLNLTIHGGTFNLPENATDISYWTNGTSYNIDFENGTIINADVSKLLKNGNKCVLQDDGMYLVQFVGCPDNENGEHTFVPVEAIDGQVVGCLFDGYYRYECSCGDSYNDIVPALGHNYSAPVITEPTLDKAGTYVWTCTRDEAICGENRVVKKYTYVPYTEDERITATLVVKTADGEKTLTLPAKDVFNVGNVNTQVTFDKNYSMKINSIKNITDPDDSSVTYTISDVLEIKIPLGATALATMFRNNVNIRKVDFSDTQEMVLDGYSFAGCTALKEIIFGDLMTVNGNTFQGCTAFEEIVFKDMDGLVVQGGDVFQGCTAIKSVRFENAHNVLLSGDGKWFMFRDCNVELFEIGDNCSNITLTGNLFGGNFANSIKRIIVGDGCTGINFASSYIFQKDCTNSNYAYELISFGASEIIFADNSMRASGNDNLTTQVKELKFSSGGTYTFSNRSFARFDVPEIIFPDGVQLKYSNNNADSFWRSTCKYVYIGDTVKEISKLFDDTKNLEVLVLKGVETILGEYAFCTGTKNSEDKPLTVYIYSENLTLKNNTFYQRNGITIYTLSNLGGYNNAFNNCGDRTIDGVTYPAYTVYYGIPCPYELKTVDPTCQSKGYDGYFSIPPKGCGDSEEAIYGVTGYKKFVKKAMTATPDEEVIFEKSNITDEIPHSGSVIRIEYANGFDKVGCEICLCDACLNEYNGNEISAIFTSKGYSVKEDGTAVMGGFTVNAVARDEYNLYAETPIVYGAIFANVNDESDITFDADNKITNEKAIQVEVADKDYGVFNYTIKGFNLENSTATTKFVITAYVIDNGNASFVQANKVGDSAFEYAGAVNEGKLGYTTLTDIYASSEYANKEEVVA